MRIYPFNSDDIVVKQKDIVSIRKDWFGFFCKVCYHPHIVKMNYVFSAKIDDMDFATNMPTTSVIFIPHFEYTCPKCHHEVEWENFLDPNITPMLAELNRKGYETEFSCEGHIVVQNDYDVDEKRWLAPLSDEPLYSCPYIYFKNPDLKEVCHYVPLLGHWHLDAGEGFENDFCISVDEQYRNKAENMAYLKRWVDCLPYLEIREFYPDMITRPIEEKIEMAKAPLTEDEKTIDYIEEE